MSIVTCPKCGCQFDPTEKIIVLQQHYHFGHDEHDVLRLYHAFQRVWRRSGAALASEHEAVYIRTKSVAVESGWSQDHCLRGLKILHAKGAIERVGKKRGWRPADNFAGFAGLAA